MWQWHMACIRLHLSPLLGNAFARSSLQTNHGQTNRWDRKVHQHNERSDRPGLHQSDDLAGIRQGWSGAAFQTRRIGENQWVEAGRKPNGSSRLSHRIRTDHIDGEAWHWNWCLHSSAYQQYLPAQLCEHWSGPKAYPKHAWECISPWLSENWSRISLAYYEIGRWEIAEFDCCRFGRIYICAEPCVGDLSIEIPIFCAEHCRHGYAFRVILCTDCWVRKGVLALRKMSTVYEIYTNEAITFALFAVRWDVFFAA